MIFRQTRGAFKNTKMSLGLTLDLLEYEELKYMQFKMLHRRIIINKKLLDMGIRENSLCT